MHYSNELLTFGVSIVIRYYDTIFWIQGNGKNLEWDQIRKVAR